LKLWRTIKVHAALTLFVAAAMTQLAQAMPAPSPEAGDAVGARWNAVADAYDARPAASYYSKRALDAMGQRMQAQVDRYDAFRTDFPSASSEPGPATTGYVVGGQLIQPGQSYAEARAANRPDDRAGIRGVERVANEPSSLSARHVALGRLSLNDSVHAARGTDAPQTVVANVDSGFDWGDAGIGALGVFGMSLILACGAVLVIIHHGRRKPVSS
jgi:hypothetical protein